MKDYVLDANSVVRYFGVGDYAQTNAATRNFVKSPAKQLGPKGIRVNGVAPGPLWTPLQVSGGATQGDDSAVWRQYAVGTAGQPSELATIYVQLAAQDASYATGQVYGSSGGGAAVGHRELEKTRACAEAPFQW
jgi:NAD(P)-dependent dehydrogenase (short-subunit alcohol dehydrogenase family)